MKKKKFQDSNTFSEGERLITLLEEDW